MIYCFDLDGTLCTNTNGKYELAKPFIERIEIVNELHKNGNKIIINKQNYDMHIKNKICVKQKQEFKCEKCKHENNYTLQGIQDFF